MLGVHACVCGKCVVCACVCVASMLCVHMCGMCVVCVCMCVACAFEGRGVGELGLLFQTINFALRCTVLTAACVHE